MEKILRRDGHILAYTSKQKAKGIKEAWKDDKGYWVTLNDGYEASRSDNKQLIFATCLSELRTQMYGIRLIDEPQPDNIIWKLRTAVNMTQADFARLLDIPLRNIENWEGGKSNPPDYLVKLIGYKLRCSMVAKAVGDTVMVTLRAITPIHLPNLFNNPILLENTDGCVIADRNEIMICKTGSILKVKAIDWTNQKITVTNVENKSFKLTFEEFNFLTNDCFLLAEMITNSEEKLQ